MDSPSQNPLIQNTFLNNNYFDPNYWFAKESAFFHNFFTFIFSDQTISIWKNILALFAIFFISIICYTAIRLLEIRKKEHTHLHHEIEEYAHNKKEQIERLHEEVGGSKNERWGITLNYLFSQHASDWKLAIIEADSMLEVLLTQLGFKGETLGEKLKSANQETFPQMTKAWEVHNVRNKIAHEGLAFELSQHEAKRIIATYEHIFHAYGFI